MSSEDLPSLQTGDMHLYFPTRLPILDLEGIYIMLKNMSLGSTTSR